MPQLFRVLNPSQTLVADSNGNGLNYIGKAALQSVTQPTVFGDNDGVSGFCTYTFTWATGIVPFITVPTGRTVWLKSMARSGSTWTIRVYCGASPADGRGLQTQYGDAEVFVFGRLTSASGTGLKIRNNAGVLTHVYTDTDGVPLYPRQILSINDADVGPSRPIVALGKHAFLGFPASFRFNGSQVNPSTWRNRVFEYGFERVGNNVILSAAVDTIQQDDASLGNNTFVVRSDTYIIEAAGLA